MGKELYFWQRSPGWFKARLGKITGSKVSDLMPSDKARTKFTLVHLTKLMEIAAENLTGIIEPTFTSTAMQWGIDHEDEARDLASFETGENFRECGFYLVDEWTGASPDGVSDKAVLEAKCPGSKKHLSYLLDSDNLLNDYFWQVYFEMYATGLDLAYLVSFDPRFIDNSKRLVIVKIEKDQEIMGKLTTRLSECIELLKEWTA